MTDDEISAVALEICQKAGKGKPDHPTLIAEIKRAAFVAFHSATFRMSIVRLTREAIAQREGGQVTLGLSDSKEALRRSATANGL